jgi:hypothetical protein
MQFELRNTNFTTAINYTYIVLQLPMFASEVATFNTIFNTLKTKAYMDFYLVPNFYFSPLEQTTIADAALNAALPVLAGLWKKTPSVYVDARNETSVLLDTCNESNSFVSQIVDALFSYVDPHFVGILANKLTYDLIFCANKAWGNMKFGYEDSTITKDVYFFLYFAPFGAFQEENIAMVTNTNYTKIGWYEWYTEWET